MACCVTQLLRARWAFSGGQSADEKLQDTLEEDKHWGKVCWQNTKYFFCKVMVHLFCSFSYVTLKSSLFTSDDILISSSLPEKVGDQCLVIPNVHCLQSFMFKTGSRYQSIADTNHCSTLNAEQRTGESVIDGWMVRGRTASADGGEETPCLLAH